MRSLIVLVVLTLTFTMISSSSLKFSHESLTALDEAWSVFTTDYKKVYVSAAEESKRKEIFAQNLKKIENHNFLHTVGLKSFRLGVNKFADLEAGEFSARMNRYKSSSTKKSKVRGSIYLSPNVNLTLPGSVDWRTKGYVTEVKDQGDCGSCYAFSTTGALEGQWFRAHGTLVSLSEQNIIDCSTDYGNAGCDGGDSTFGFEYIQDNGGIEGEETYPYEQSQGDCRYEDDYSVANSTGFIQIPVGEDHLKEAVATLGPIAAAINCADSFQLYSSGVYDEPTCTDVLDHAILVVGYGTDRGKDFWLVKNSYGDGWGENGYIRMSRNKKNQCGIANEGSYPLV